MLWDIVYAQKETRLMSFNREPSDSSDTIMSVYILYNDYFNPNMDKWLHTQ